MNIIEYMVNKREPEVFAADYLQTENEKWKDDIQKGLDRYQELVTKKEKIEALNKEMFYVKPAASDGSDPK